jgi:hypothetical protein
MNEQLEQLLQDGVRLQYGKQYIHTKYLSTLALLAFCHANTLA